MGAIVVLCVVWGGFWSMFAKFAPSPGLAFGMFVFAWAPGALAAWFFIGRAGRRAQRHADMLRAVGVAPGSGFEHSEGGTGIALNAKERVVALVDGKVHKSYSYEDIREWVAQEERAGQAIGVGLQGVVTAGGANIRAAREAAANTGLFVTVRDLERPRWRVAMKDKTTRARWMELLRQEVNERGAA